VSADRPGKDAETRRTGNAAHHDDDATRPFGRTTGKRVTDHRSDADAGDEETLPFPQQPAEATDEDETRFVRADAPEPEAHGAAEQRTTAFDATRPLSDYSDEGGDQSGDRGGDRGGHQEQATRVVGPEVDPALAGTELVDQSSRPSSPRASDRTERIDDATARTGGAGGSAPAGATEVMSDSPGSAGPAPTARLPGEATHGAAASGGIGLSVGSVLRNRFRITGTLGEGGMGAVFSAVDMLKEEAKDESTDVALKVMKADIVDATMSFMGLQREARRAQQLAHPNIVTVYDFDRADGVIYMTMEYLRGKPLDALLEDNPHGLDLETARDITTQICKGLAYAHNEGIVHADLKPQNVFVLENGRAKILDFGIARAYQAKKVDVVESVFSGYSPPFASPEIMARKNPAPSDDIYALGCVVYQIFTGRHPFNYTPAPKAQQQGLKPVRDGSFKRAEWAAVSAALSFDGTKRPADAAEFLKRFAPSRVRQVALAVSLASVLAAGAFIALYEPPVGPEIPFEELPAPLQQQITRNVNDAERFLSFGDLDSAMQLFDAVLTSHPGNLAATDGMDRAVSEAISRVRTAVQRGETSPEAARQTLQSILDYETLPADSRKDLDSEIDRL